MMIINTLASSRLALHKLEMRRYMHSALAGTQTATVIAQPASSLRSAYYFLHLRYHSDKWRVQCRATVACSFHFIYIIAIVVLFNIYLHCNGLSCAIQWARECDNDPRFRASSS